MYIYDKARSLAEDIKRAPEYTQYKSIKDEVFADVSSKELISRYKKLQFEAQAAVMTGKQPDSATMDELKKLGDVLAFNPKVSEYFAAEYKFNTLISDIYKILGEACEVGIDFLQE